MTITLPQPPPPEKVTYSGSAVKPPGEPAQWDPEGMTGDPKQRGRGGDDRRGGGRERARHPSPKKGRMRGARGEKGRQEMLPEIPNPVRRNRVGNPVRRDPRAGRGLFGAEEECQHTAFLPADPSSRHLSTPDKLPLSSNPKPAGHPSPAPCPPPQAGEVEKGSSVSLLAGLRERTPDTALIRERGGQETQGGPGPG